MTRYRRRYRRRYRGRPVAPHSHTADFVAGLIGRRQPRTQADINDMLMIPVILLATLFFCFAVLGVMWLVNNH